MSWCRVAWSCTSRRGKPQDTFASFLHRCLKAVTGQRDDVGVIGMLACRFQPAFQCDGSCSESCQQLSGRVLGAALSRTVNLTNVFADVAANYNCFATFLPSTSSITMPLLCWHSLSLTVVKFSIFDDAPQLAWAPQECAVDLPKRAL